MDNHIVEYTLSGRTGGEDMDLVAPGGKSICEKLSAYFPSAVRFRRKMLGDEQDAKRRSHSGPGVNGFLNASRSFPAMGRKHVCFVLASAYRAYGRDAVPGGAELQFRFFAEALAARGFDVTVICGGVPTHERIVFLPLKNLRATLRRIRPDVVIGTIASRPTMWAALCCRSLGIPFVYRIAHDIESELCTNRATGGNVVERFFFGLVLRRLTSKIWCQHGEQKTALEAHGLGKKLFVCYNAFPSQTGAGKRRRTTILWVGRFVSWKRPEFFLDIARSLPERECVMVVPGASKAFLNRAREIGNLRVIEGLPFEDIQQLFSSARVLINTSLMEGFPNTFIQSAMVGTPIISTGVDPDGLFARFGHGFVLPHVEDIQSKVKWLFADGPGFSRMSREALRYFREMHTLERTVETLIAQILPGGR